jgi:hypothetical protein
MERILPREAYVSGVFFRREAEAIFFRDWFCADIRRYVEDRLG